MARLSSVLRSVAVGRIAFQCPGCGTAHVVPVLESESPHWDFNGDFEKPTLYPSLLITHFLISELGKLQYIEWYERGMPNRKGERFDGVEITCHSFVTAGFIEFLKDSTHKLAGQTVPLPDFDYGAW